MGLLGGLWGRGMMCKSLIISILFFRRGWGKKLMEWIVGFCLI
jgi:hypothetical protein